MSHPLKVINAETYAFEFQHLLDKQHNLSTR